jgi:hypothetical protein
MVYNIDMNTENLVKNIKARFDHAVARKVLKEKYEAKMLFAYNGGMWKASPELLTLLEVCVDDEAVILDLYDNPIRVNVAMLQTLASERWQEQMNAWETEYQEINKQR